ncbi:MAG: hypothetical protein JW395_2952 [Nitrospira sp.]|nr:hypothetical protein [Nitrospira sp.]
MFQVGTFLKYESRTYLGYAHLLFFLSHHLVCG